MLGVVALVFGWLSSLLKSRRRLQAENLILRHQVNILRRRAPGRTQLSNPDRLVFVWLYRLCPTVVDAVAIIRPETLIRWHRRGCKAFWRWKSRSRGGRPTGPHGDPRANRGDQPGQLVMGRAADPRQAAQAWH